MREGIIFELRAEDLNKGLRGVPVGSCFTSEVDPQKGLSYATYPIAELSSWDPYEVIFLLLYGDKGNEAQVSSLRKDLKSRAFCKNETLGHLQAIIQPRVGHPMDVFAASLLIVGMHEGTGSYEEDCLNVIAKLPQIVAFVINQHAGWGETPLPDPQLGYMENFLNMLQFPGERKEELAEIIRLFNITHYDHDGGNLSTFVGKAVASGLEPIWGSLAASMAALSGPLHGRANQECLEFTKEIMSETEGDLESDRVEEILRKRLSENKKLFGFGHAVLRVEDPRATVFYERVKELFPENSLVKTALLLREIGPKILKENPKIQNPYPNIDAITGSALSAAGFIWSDYYTVLFGLARCVGIAIQIKDERTFLKSPIMRPNYFFRRRPPGNS
jgi:citrate synthase